jgi:hypothetical protein
LNTGRDAVGHFVVRESTSVPNSFVLSVIQPNMRIEHLWLQSEGGRIVFSGTTYASLNAFVTLHQIQPFTLDSCPNVPFTLGVCLKGENIYA